MAQDLPEMILRLSLKHTKPPMLPILRPAGECPLPRPDSAAAVGKQSVAPRRMPAGMRRSFAQAALRSFVISLRGVFP
ncbi:hypothetical protein GCM10011341_36200 [Frigidibacter albus]|nr:hypothetical protein GCM10011341_36200 [Frigidibacter albus]